MLTAQLGIDIHINGVEKVPFIQPRINQGFFHHPFIGNVVKMRKILLFVTFVTLISLAKGQLVDCSAQSGVACDPRTFGKPFCCGPGTDTLNQCLNGVTTTSSCKTISGRPDSTCVNPGGPGTHGGLLCT